MFLQGVDVQCVSRFPNMQMAFLDLTMFHELFLWHKVEGYHENFGHAYSISKTIWNSCN